MDKEYKMNLQALWYILRARLIWVILIGIICGLSFGAVSRYLITPIYSSTAKLYVYNTDDQKQNAITFQDLNAAQSLVDTYIVIIKSDTVLENVAEAAGVNYTPKQLKKMITAGAVSGTEVFYVTVSHKDRGVALKIAEAIVVTAKPAIEDIVQSGGVSVVDYPKLATESDSPNIVRNSLIGIAAGCVISFVCFFLKEVLDITIYCEDDIKNISDYPIIGMIPTFTVPEEGKGKLKSIALGSPKKSKGHSKRGGDAGIKSEVDENA